MAVYYRARIRSADDTTNALILTSVPSGTNPYISEPPTGDGQGFNPRTGATEVGAYMVRIADNGGTANAVTGFLSDGNGRYDKLGRRAYLEYGTDGTTFPNLLVAGYITGISYASAAEAVVSIGEAQRTERLRQAFVTANSTFPATMMLGGGPIRWPAGVVTPVNWPNRGPWTMSKVITAGGATELRFVSGYVLTDETAVSYSLATNGALPSYMRNRINTLVATEVPGAGIVGPFPPFGMLQQFGNVYADVYSGGTLVGTFPAVIAGYDNGAVSLIYNTNDIALAWSNADAIGTQYQLYLYTRTISENSPIHLLMHPMDIVTGLISDAGELWDTTSAAAVKASIGADYRIFLRISESEAIDAFIAKLLGLFGVGRRINSANQWEFFDARAKSTSAPSVTIAQDDLREIPSEIWALADSTILNNVTVTTERFAIWAPGQSSTRPPDGLVPVEQKRTARFQLADGTFPDTTQGIKELSYDLPGTILNANGAEIDLQAFTAALAAPAFDRWGYGAPSGRLACRDTITAKVGDEVLLNLPFLPNANVRGGQRIVQVVQRTNEAGGSILAIEDAGMSAQASLSPTFTIVASTGNAMTQADLALTNAAALTAAGVVYVLIEWAVSALSPTVAGQDLGALVPASASVISTPPVAAGSKVWARMKSIQPGKRSGTFTAWAGVTLAGVGVPTSLAFVADGTDGSKGTLSWTAGASSSTYGVRVLRRRTALSAASDQPVVDLLPGSTATPLSEMLPATNYTVTVQYFDRSTGIVASSATLAFTSGSAVLVLTEPTEPVGIVGRTDTNGVAVVDGTFGLDVKATQVPGTVEFWTAVELLAGTGFFPAALLVFATPSVNGAPTSYRSIAPHDGLKRKLTARHVAVGATSSPFTSAQIVDPWGPAQLPGWIPPALTKWDWSDSPTARTFTWTRNANTHAVWIYDTVVAVGGGSGWPVPGQLPNTILPAGTDTYVALIPPSGFQRFVKAEPRTDRGVPGDSPSSVVDATPIGLTYNQVITTISATTATTISVTVTATAPLGTPTVQLDSVTGSATLLSGPAIGVASPSGTTWVFTRGAALGGPGQALFRAIAAGNVDDTKAVEIPEVGRDTVYLVMRARVLSSNATSITVRVAVADPYPQGTNSVTVAYQDLGSGGVSPATGGTLTPAATLVASEAAAGYIDYTITRPAFQAGTGRVTFTATASGRVTDSDGVEVPAQERDTVALTVRARQTAQNASTITVRVAVADAYPQGAASATINYLDQGSGGVSPATGGTVTPAATITEAAGTFIDYVITRPAFGVGAGLVAFTATAANRTSISAPVVVPEVGRDTVPLTARARVLSQSSTSMTVRVAVADPFPQGANTATISYQDLGSGGVSPASGGTVTPASTIATSEAAGTYIDYTITLPAFGAGPGRVTFTITAANRVSTQDAADVPTQDRDTVQITLKADVIASDNLVVDVQMTANDPLGGTPTISVASTGTPAVTATSLGSNQWRLTRPAITAGSGRVVFQAVLAGRTTAYEGVTVQPTTPVGTAKSLIISNAAFQPVSDGFTFSNTQVGLTFNAGAGSGTTQKFIAFVPLPQGVTITSIDMTSRAKTTGSVANTLTLYRQTPGGFGAATVIVTATRTAVNFDLGGTDSSTTTAEVVSTKTYCLVAQISDQADHVFFTATVYYTMPSYDVGI